jgi:chromosome segregation protein
MAQFSRLRLQGFKSFVDKTELDICKGMTGIVGPNGCGKSNLVEALSWVMGETSAKRLRGSGMDDVIFNGTSLRPARNSAEVSVVIDNSDRTAPTLFNNSDEIEIVRRIERDMGSSYYVNGKVVRARDVQMLFADIGIGAHSAAIVSQGRIAAIINMKPAERRQILEESAGVSGLYVRRHEAELRLRAADNNLARLQDIMANLESQLDSLKRQSRQATRYKNISGDIKQLETHLALAEWMLAQEQKAQAEQQFLTAEKNVAEAMTTVAQLSRTYETQNADVPPLREKQAETAAAWQVQNFEMKRLDDEQARLENQIDETKQNLAQISSDRAHEQQIMDENTVLISRLESEEAELQQVENTDEQLGLFQASKKQAQDKVDAVESEYRIAVEKSATLRASRQTLTNQLSQDQSRLTSLENRMTQVKSDIERIKQTRNHQTSNDDIHQRISTLEAALQNAQTHLDQHKNNQEHAQSTLENARSEFQNKRDQVQKIRSEISALQSVLESESEKGFRPILEDIKADEGFEAALTKALGDTLMASTDRQAPSVWENPAEDVINAIPHFADPVRALAPHIQAPEALKVALKFIGYVDTDDQGEAASRSLKIGQSLVSRSGGYWRWDGYRVRANAADRNAIRLKNKNRLDDLQGQLPDLERDLQSAEHSHQEAQQKFQDLKNQLSSLEQNARQAERDLNNSRIELQRSMERQAREEGDLLKAEETLALLSDDFSRLSLAVETHQASLAQFDEQSIDQLQQDLERLKSNLHQAQQELQDAVTALEVFQQDQSRRSARLRAVADERVNLQNRIIRARERLKSLEEREASTQGKLQDLKDKPKNIEGQRLQILDRLASLESAKNEAADKLAIAENELAQTHKALKQAEESLSQARELRAHSQAMHESALGSIEILRQSVQDQFALSPEDLWEQSSFTEEKLKSETVDKLRGKRDRLIRERDGMGPVNLRADVEAQEVEDQLNKLINERNDLTAAIDELRQAINKLNKEARERIQTAFETVNNHFKVLFTRLFGGGTAHLAFVESDDPLEASLEIFAQPPGKSLQSLSLLSGGEKTLASTALLFAMFLTNPSPLCVLDEIDAPLDDANVDRVCGMLEEISASGKTRFIIITHHRLTMARMDRLYGVTMAERGVSQLVSVDLQQKLEFLEAA